MAEKSNNPKKTTEKPTTDEKIHILLTKLKAKNFKAQNDAVQGLGKINHKKAKEALIEIIESDVHSSRIRVNAINTLSKSKKDAKFENILRKIALDQEIYHEIRRAALTQLARFRNERNIDVFSKALNDEYRFTRFWAVRGLIKLRSQKSIPALVMALGDEDEEIRKDVQEHLELFGTMSVPPLISALKRKDANKFLRYGAVGLLGRIDHPDCVDALIKSLNDGNDRVVTIALRALGKIQDKKAIKPLIELYNSRKTFQKQIQRALFKIGEVECDSVIYFVSKAILDYDDDYKGLVEALIKKLSPNSLFVLDDLLSQQDIDPELKAALAPFGNN